MAEDLKSQGNAAFAKKEYSEAIRLYTAALIDDPNNSVLYSNRAICYLKIGDHHKALQDCDEGLAKVVDEKTKSKLLFRKASAFVGIGSIKLAKQYFQKVLDIDHENVPAKSELAKLQDDAMEGVVKQRVEIPVQKVDKLPEEYQRYLDGTQPVSNSQKSSTSPPIKEKSVANDDVIAKEIEELFPKNSKKNSSTTPNKPEDVPFVQRSATSLLATLKTIPGAQKDKAYLFVINLPVSDIQDNFHYGIDPEFLSFYLEAAVFVSSNNAVANWHQLVLNTLTTLSALPRYELSKTFCEEEHIKMLMINVQRLQDPELEQKYAELLS